MKNTSTKKKWKWDLEKKKKKEMYGNWNLERLFAYLIQDS